MPARKRVSKADAPLPQKLGLVAAVGIGLASMLGAGLFVVFREAFNVSASSYFWAIGLAALVAALNATSVHRLAKRVERAGGIYAYSRVYVGRSTSFLAGFGFIFGKIGSIAAIALVLGEYVTGTRTAIWLALLAIWVLAIVNIFGIERTAEVAIVLATVTVGFLLIVIIGGLTWVAPLHETNYQTLGGLAVVTGAAEPPKLGDVLQASALLFFAFAGYARVATLGEEVSTPKVNIPRAIVISLGAVIVLYIGLGTALYRVLGDQLGTSVAPLEDLVARGIPSMPPQVVVIVAAAAALGSMLALLAGVSRTAASMAEDRELPRWVAKRNRYGSPWRAELVIAVAASALVTLPTLSWVIAFSSFSVLMYYAIGHISALRQARLEETRKFFVPAMGLVFCASLAATVPGPALPTSAAILALAMAARIAFRHMPRVPKPVVPLKQVRREHIHAKKK